MTGRSGAVLERLARVATETGLFTVLAIDHVGSFAQTVSPDHPDAMTATDISAAKQPIIAALGPISRAILIDPGYLMARESTVDGRPDGMGLILGIEDGDYADVRTAPRLLPGWSVERAAEMGADAVKISVYYDPDGDITVAVRFVTEVVAQCREVGLPLFCEPLALYEDPKDRRWAVLEGVRRFGPLGAEVLKLQFPVMPDAGLDRSDWAEACAEIDRLSPVPWVILSEGSDFRLFLDQVRVACAAGASGFLGGRAIWREMATGEGDQRQAVERLTELCAVAHDEGTPWRTSPARRGGITWADPAVVGDRRLYSDLAHLWPVVSPPEDYAEEAIHWRDAIRSRLGEGRHRILELGVGGGHNLSHLTADFDATAVDLSPEMLEHSRRLNPDVEHHVGDMRTVRLGKVFDAVLIHDAVSYMLTEDDLRSAFSTARVHLRPGGLLLVAPDLVAESFREGRVLRWDNPPPARPGDPEVRVEERLTDPDPTDTTIESWITFTITEAGCQRVETDRHVTGLFPMETWVAIMEDAGFETEVLPLPGDGDGCGEHLFSGILRRKST